MRGWIIAIVGVVVLGVLLEIILPDGEVTKYIRGIFSIIVVVVIVTPIAQILSGDKKFEFDIKGAQIEYDDNYIRYFYQEQKLSDENKLLSSLSSSKIVAEKVEIIVKDDKSYKIKGVNLYFSVSSIKNVDKGKTIQIVKSHFGNVEIIFLELPAS